MEQVGSDTSAVSLTSSRGSWRQKDKQSRRYGTYNRGPIRALEYSKGRRRGNKSNDEPLSPKSVHPGTVIKTTVHPGTVIKTTVQQLNLECVKPQRAGVIIYTVVNGSIYFGLGLDSRTHDLTDFGGGVVYKIDKHAINGALREFEEETLSIFDPIQFEDIIDCPVIYDNRNLIIFVHLNVDPDTVCLAFIEKFKKSMADNVGDITEHSGKRRSRESKEPEVCGITWLTWGEFQYCIANRGILFSRVQKFLARADNFSHLL